MTRRQLDSIIKELVSSGELIYTNHFSISHLELNHFHEIEISNRLLLTTDNSKSERLGVVAVRINSGASFGMGDHATTRLALKGIDYIVRMLEREGRLSSTNVLDIGTGSGVLAIAAVRLGANWALALDIDPVARHEAAENARLNGLHDRMIISEKSLELVESPSFQMILANLRPPTLKQLFPGMIKLSEPGCYWILSGFRPDEGNRIEKQLNSLRLATIWSLDTDNWAALALKFGI
jgi:ribosomal protein L11 methyltransferase